MTRTTRFELTCNHEPKGTDDHDNGLDEVGPDNSGQTSDDGKQSSDDEQHDDRQVDIPAQRLVDEDCTCEQVGLLGEPASNEKKARLGQASNAYTGPYFELMTVNVVYY